MRKRFTWALQAAAVLGMEMETAHLAGMLGVTQEAAAAQASLDQKIDVLDKRLAEETRKEALFGLGRASGGIVGFSGFAHFAHFRTHALRRGGDQCEGHRDRDSARMPVTDL